MAKVKVVKRKKREDYSAAFVIGAVVGGLAGALGVLWTTPKTGQEIRQQIVGAVPSIGGPSTLNFGTTSKSEAASTVAERPTTSVGSTTSTSVSSTETRIQGSASGEPPAEGLGHVATTEELVTPPSPEEQAKIRANAEAILNDQRPS